MVLHFWCQNIFFVLDVLEWEDIHGPFSDDGGNYGILCGAVHSQGTLVELFYW